MTHAHASLAGLALALALPLAATAAPQPDASPVAQTHAQPIPGDAARGKALYQACTACHSLDDNDLGPKHRGVVGRPAGAVPGFAYSAALRNSGLVWDAATLDRWLINPQALVPGTKMYFLIADPQTRADIIAFLAQQK
jgi:cytochrome c